MSAFDAYLKNLDKALQARNATEHTHRPALKTFLESVDKDIEATNEPERIECGAPDFIVTGKGIPLGYLEAKDIGADLDKAEESEQLQRYRESLRNLILTDYLEFRLYRNGELIQSARAATVSSGKVRRAADGAQQVERLLRWFVDADVPTIATPRELAERMARLARLIRDLIGQVFAHEGRRGDLHGQFDAFRKVLIADLSVGQFADMYAQTIAYGLFAARCNHVGSGFDRQHAGRELPKTNPFLRKLFNSIAGADLDERIAWAVDDLAQLLGRADMAAILEDFGKATRREDPVVHFYETFLAAYDPQLRETRGVYYTPEPVVNYIVRSVDTLLRKTFKLPSGLADRSEITLQLPTPHGERKTKRVKTHRVQILDPACGTGTFLHSVVSVIQDAFTGGKGIWPGYVANYLLPRVYGFELLMAPYAVAHMKLGLQLHESGYDFSADERLRVFLTNSLEEGHELARLPLFAQWLADEAAAASEVKRDVPIMVVLGNPPYSGISANRGEWIERMVETYKREPDGSRLNEHKHWLNDDYVKFLRFAQWRVEQTGYGVVAMVTNHGYLDNPTFRGMRHSLMQTFDAIHVLDLHGNSKKRERAPDGSADKNVFDIQQGVAICVMVRTGEGGTAEIKHAELWGSRAHKYEWLDSHGVDTTEWTTVRPELPFLFFYPRKDEFQSEYAGYPSLAEAFEIWGLGFQSSRDHIVVGFAEEELKLVVEHFIDPALSDSDIRAEFFPGKKVADYQPGDTRQWSLSKARVSLQNDPNWRKAIRRTLYRPFDVRYILYDERMVDWPRPEVLGHMTKENVCLLVNRQSKESFAVLCSDLLTERKIAAVYDASTSMPLYVYDLLGGGKKRANFSPKFVSVVSDSLGLTFDPSGIGDLKRTVGAEQVFHYIYAVLYSPTYRKRYETFLRTDFPRIPVTTDVALFGRLVRLGQRLVQLHLMNESVPNPPEYPVRGNNRVDKIEYEEGRIYINSEQYFDAVSSSQWAYQIGGYQVAQKWLKDRKGRKLSFHDLQHYGQLLALLRETIALEGEIDAAISGWPLP